MLCDFAHTGRRCRDSLFKQGGVTFYLRLLGEKSWSGGALEALAVWFVDTLNLASQSAQTDRVWIARLQDDTKRLETVLIERNAFDQLLTVFVSSTTSDLENLLEPFHKVLRVSLAVSRLFSLEPAFYVRINQGLLKSNQAIVRLGLLKLIKLVYETTTALPLPPSPVPLCPHLSRRTSIVTSSSTAEQFQRSKHQRNLLGDLVLTIDRLAMDDPAILARGMARQLSREFATWKLARDRT